MRDTIYLIVNRNGVQGMRKSLVEVKRGETVVKINVEMAADAFAPPVLTQDVVIDSWHKGIDVQDVEFKNSVITEEEAEVIRQRRLEKMARILGEQGYTVTKEEADDDGTEDDQN